MSDDPRIEAVLRFLKYVPVRADDLDRDEVEKILAVADAAAWRPISEAPDTEEVLVARHDPDGSEWYATAMWLVDRFAFFAGDPRQSRDPILLCFEPTHFRYLTPPQEQNT